MPREAWLLLVLLMTLLAVLILVSVWALYPIFGTTLISLLYLAWWYVSTEQSNYLHHAQEVENRFLTLLAFVFSSCLVFIHDSPLAIGHWSIGAGVLVVALVTFSVHTYDRHLHRLWIARVPHMSSGYASSSLLSTIVDDKLQRINRSLGQMDNALVATNIQYLIMSNKMLELEHRVVNILQDCTTDELNYLLPRMRLALVLYKVKDHSDAPHRTKLLDLIAATRVTELSVTSRAVVLDAMQQMRLTAHPKSDAYVRNILVKTLADDLTRLKCLCDNKGDFQSLHKLVFNDIKDEDHRKAILKHIRHQANILAAHVTLRTKVGRDRSIKPWRKVLSDIDDTLTCSGGRYPAGVDTSLPRKTVYPGVLQFLKYLDLGKWGPRDWPPGWNGNLVFLSARPHLYKYISEAHTFTKFKKLKDQHGMHTTPSLLPGSVETGASFVIRNDMEPIARNKYRNFEEYASLYPEFRMVFIGDNGQGDVRAAELMLESRLSGHIDAVFIHLVQPLEATYGYNGPETLQKWQNMGIHFFSDYISAAVDAYDEGLIHTEGMQCIGRKAVAEFEALTLSSPLVRESQRRLMNNSIERANAKLRLLDLYSIPLVHSICVFQIGALVTTPLGLGRVQAFRPPDGVYEVALEWSTNTRDTLRPPNPSQPFMAQQPLTDTTDAILCNEDVDSGDHNIPSEEQYVVPPSHITSNCIAGQGPPNYTGGAQLPLNYKEAAGTKLEIPSQPQLVDAEHPSSSWSLGYDQEPPVTCQIEEKTTTTEEDGLPGTTTPLGPPSAYNDVDLLSNFPVNYVMERSESDLELCGLNDRIHEDENKVFTPLRQISSAAELSLPKLVISEVEKDDGEGVRSPNMLSNPIGSGKSSSYTFPFGDKHAGVEQIVKVEMDSKQGQPREQWLFRPVGYFQLEALQHATTGTAKSRTGGRFGNTSLAVTPFYSKKRTPKRKRLRVGDPVILPPFGAAKIVSLPYRGSATCELIIHGWVLRNGKAAKAYVPVDILENGEMKKVSSPFMYPQFLGKSLLGLFSSSPKSPYAKQKGLRVVTPFGAGIVLQFREALPDEQQHLSDSSFAIVAVHLVDWPLRKKGSYAVAHLRASEVWLEGGTPEVQPFVKMFKPQSSSALARSFSSLMSSFRRPYQTSSTVDSSVPLSSYPMCIPLGTLIKTPLFGLGIVKACRQFDGIYTVSLLDVRQRDNRCSLSYVNNAGLGDILCAPGDWVITPFGLGKVLRTREETAVAVEVLVGIMHCFLQPQAIDRIAPTPLGHQIITPLGQGMVQSFSSRTQTYCIDLGWGTMYVPESTAWDGLSSVKTEEGLGIVSSMWNAFFRGFGGHSKSITTTT